jgi:hypothetical protein
MEVPLDQVCRVVPNGGDHKTRKRTAKKLMHSAGHGNTTLGDFHSGASRAQRNFCMRHLFLGRAPSAKHRVARI